MTGSSFNTGYYQNLMGYQQVGNMFAGGFSAPSTGGWPGMSFNPAQTAVTNPWSNIAWGDFSSANTNFTNLSGGVPFNPAQTAVTNPNTNLANIPTNFNVAQSPASAYIGLNFSNLVGPIPKAPTSAELMKDPFKYVPNDTKAQLAFIQYSMSSALTGLKEQVAQIVADPANYGNSGANGGTGGTGSTGSGQPISAGRNPDGSNVRATQTMADYKQRFGVTNLGIWGDEAHKKTKSDHNTGDAADLGVSSIAQGNQVTDALLKEVEARGIKYIIFNHKIWSVERKNEGWRPYTGDNPHTDHVHVSFYA